MAVKYVNDFSFPSDFGFQKNSKAAVPGKARGGHISTPQRYARGGEAKYSGHAKKSDDKPMSPAGAGKLSEKSSSRHTSKTMPNRGSPVPSRMAPNYRKGGKIHKAEGGVAHGKVKDGQKKPWNPDDEVSPGSPTRDAPKQGMSNQKAARDKFATKGENTEPATKQIGNVQRMTGFSDFKRGGHAKKRHADGGQIKTEDRFETGDKGQHVPAPDKQEKGDGMKYAKGGKASTPQAFSGGGHKAGCGCSMCGGGRIGNLGNYAHGGKVHEGAKGSKGEKTSGKATGKSHEKAQGSKRKDTHEKKVSATRSEVKSTEMAQHTEPNNAKEAIPLAGGGLSRGTSPKRNAAIHAKMHHAAPSMAGPLAAAAGQMGGQGMPHPMPGPGMGATPPGMAPGMGSPPGGMMGGMRPQGPPMGAPAMAAGGGVKHTVVHHVHYKR